MTDLIKFDPMEEMPNIIKVIGVGGGGSNAVTHMFTEGIQGVDFILCNTDYQALEKSPVAMKIHLGKRALGAGNIPAVGREAAMETTDELREILSKDTKMLFITAGMGGGTGTGAAPVVAEIARELGILTVGIVTMPFTCEGKRRQQQAFDGIAEMKKHVDTLLVISNDKLRDEYGNMKLTQAFKKADDVLKTAAKGIAEIITVTGYVNVDFQDVNTVMRNSGKAIMGSGFAEGKDRAMRAVEEAVNSPLLDDSDISGAKNILIYITSGTEEVSLDEVMDITQYVQDATGNCSEVIWGNGEDPALGEGINVTLIATGFDNDKSYTTREDDNQKKIHDMYDQAACGRVEKVEPVAEPKPMPMPQPQENEIRVINKKKEEEEVQIHIEKENDKKKIVHPLGSEDNGDCDDDDVRPDVETSRPVSHEVNTAPAAPVVTTQTLRPAYINPFNNDDEEDLGIKHYVRDAAETQTVTMVRHEVKSIQQNKDISQQEMLRRKRLSSLNNFSTVENIEALENMPAYMRRGVNISFDKEEQELSKYSYSKGYQIKENNSYLHDNVD